MYIEAYIEQLAVYGGATCKKSVALVHECVRKIYAGAQTWVVYIIYTTFNEFLKMLLSILVLTRFVAWLGTFPEGAPG